MEPGAWIALAAFILGSFFTLHGYLQSSKDDRIKFIREELDRANRECKRCRRELNTARSWIQWASENMQLKPGAKIMPALPNYVPENDGDEEDGDT